jgi:hypothetical protein
MTNLLETITTQLRYFTQEEIIALVGDFLAELDEKQQTRFLNVVTQGPRPLVAEAMGFDDIEYLLEQDFEETQTNGRPTSVQIPGN